MARKPKELQIPDCAARDKRSVELLRVWAAQGKQHVSIATGWKDPACWGIMLVDLAKHIANAYQLTAAFSHEDALRRIKSGFDAEWAVETDEPTGHMATPPVERKNARNHPPARKSSKPKLPE